MPPTQKEVVYITGDDSWQTYAVYLHDTLAAPLVPKEKPTGRPELLRLLCGRTFNPKMDSTLSSCNEFKDLKNTNFCILDKVRYSLCENRLYQLSAAASGSNDLGAARAIDIDPHGFCHSFQWMLPYSNSMLILIGSRPFAVEETIVRCDEPPLLSDHQIDLPVQPQITTSDKESAKICDKCLQYQPAKSCWSCYNCDVQDPLSDGAFDVCMRCLQNGKWCRDISHYLSKSEQSTKKLEWKPTHVIVSVDFSSDEPLVKTIFLNRLLYKTSGEPFIDAEGGNIIWPVDGILLRVSLTTGDSNVLETVKGDRTRLDGQPLTLEQRIKDEGEPGTQIQSHRIQQCFKPLILKDGFCSTCTSTLAASPVLRNSSNWKEMTREEAQGSKIKNEEEPLDIDTLQHHNSIAELARSISTGCRLCLRLWQRMDTVDKKTVRLSIRQLRPGSIVDGKRNNAQLELMIKRFDSGLGELFLQIKCNEDKKESRLGGRGCKIWRSTASEYKHIGIPHCDEGGSIGEKTSWTDSNKTFAVARAWLKNCCAYHQCSTHNQWFPTRLIHVDRCSIDRSLRLQIMKGDAKNHDGHNLEYLTLSHCWGGSNDFRLTKASAESLIRGFSISELPATFQDAVEICRRLGYQYLWIDSLCIVQDDAEDWAREASLMASVYQNSACTIAALSTESTHSGCFSVRYDSGGCEEPHYFRDRDNGLFFAFDAYRTEDADIAVEEHHLNSRAWVFQERLLSPRTLGFTETGIIWDCKEAQYTERDPTSDRSSIKFANRTRDKEMLQQATKPILKGHTSVINRNDFLKAWYELVTDYSGLKLTFPSDKLIALAGITSRIQVLVGYVYFYGLWNDPGDSSFFLSQLLWHTVEPEKNIGSAGPDFRPPSFSWATCYCKIDYPITFHDRISYESNKGVTSKSGWIMVGNGRYFEFLYRHTFRLFRGDGGRGGNPWDRSIEFRANIVSLHAHGGGHTSPFIIMQRPLKEVEIRLGNVQNEGLVWEYPWDTVPADDERNDSQRNRWFFPDSFLFPSRLTMLTIARWWRSWDRKWYIAGLALMPAGGGVYASSKGRERTKIPFMQRVGYFEHSWVTQHEHWYDEGDMAFLAIT